MLEEPSFMEEDESAAPSGEVDEVLVAFMVEVVVVEKALKDGRTGGTAGTLLFKSSIESPRNNATADRRHS